MIAAVVLAAGRAERFGELKQLVEIDGKPLLEHVLHQLRASTIADVVVVLGARSDDIRRRIDFLQERVVINDQHATGMASSIQTGIRELPDGITAALFVLADQPLVRSSTYDAIVNTATRGADAVVPTYRGARGNPVLISARLFPDFMQLGGDVGFRAILSGRNVVEIEVDDPGIVRDIDTPDDLKRVLE